MAKDPEMNGCIHIHMENGKPVSAVVHIAEQWIPKNGVIHAKLNKVYQKGEFGLGTGLHSTDAIREKYLTGIVMDVYIKEPDE